MREKKIKEFSKLILLVFPENVKIAIEKKIDEKTFLRKKKDKKIHKAFYSKKKSTSFLGSKRTFLFVEHLGGRTSKAEGEWKKK